MFCVANKLALQLHIYNMQTGKRYTKKQIENVCRLVRVGKTYKEIEEKTGVNKYAVAFWARRAKKQKSQANGVDRDEAILTRVNEILLSVVDLKSQPCRHCGKPFYG